jgi:hypothetical protein
MVGRMEEWINRKVDERVKEILSDSYQTLDLV